MARHRVEKSREREGVGAAVGSHVGALTRSRQPKGAVPESSAH